MRLNGARYEGTLSENSANGTGPWENASLISPLPRTRSMGLPPPFTKGPSFTLAFSVTSVFEVAHSASQGSSAFPTELSLTGSLTGSQFRKREFV
ncbi:hypothetical protein LSTR_LSTR003420 [Laodelphax striatellus]|uniref:Uncharacterized protein n=1 Tax=Laodelphax striatellus TaxID=195883 RepID=A0A482X1P0_LAOST|nr:hypothetical protein LSTR_LSTR003420 [Laodelphax striatellus]